MAAAAGAGYLAKYWQNVFRDKEGLSGFPPGSSAPHNPVSRSSVQEKTDLTCPFGTLSPRKTADQYLSENGNENHSDCTWTEKSGTCRLGTAELTSTSYLDRGKQVETYEDGNMPSSSIFPPEFRKHETCEYESGYRLGSDMSDIPENHIWETGWSSNPRRSRNSIRSKCVPLQFIKPRSSLDSCLVAQMHRERGEMEDYVLSPREPCAPTLRPFLVTDGRRLIGRASRDFRGGLHRESHPKTSDGMVGVPYLPQIGATDYPKLKLDIGKNQMGRTSNYHTLVQLDARDASPGGQFIFCLGISIGIMYAIIAQNLEVGNLKESLKQSENLVQDLQEELEMKDSLTVKELVIDDSSQDAQVDTNVLTKYADEDSVCMKEVESMSKIEAELEAELERLELSMSGTALLSDAIELEHEFGEDIVAELVHGELRADVLRRKSSSEPTPDRGSSSTSTPLSANYGVSPRELSLRLHEVIESRLQQRIMELEEELAKTQKRVYHLESERVKSWREVWNSESSSNPSSPIIVEAHSPVAQPLVMNLSGDALDAYNEAFEELSNLKGTQKGDHVRVNGHKDDQLATYRVSNGKQNGNRDFDITMSEITGEGPMPNGRTQIPLGEETPNCDEGNDDDDDEDLLLIKQIVEKAKQGSPAILRAQRALVYLEREE